MCPAHVSSANPARYTRSEPITRPSTVAVTEGGKRNGGERPVNQELCIEIRRPFVFEKAATSLTELSLVTNYRSRVKSARLPTPSMHRSHVGVARFYDWSDDPADCFPVSRLYREIASVPRFPASRATRINGNAASSSTIKINLTPGRNFSVGQGRMFVRDKKALTRGEREIIEGINKNRGDVSARDLNCRTDLIPKDHRDGFNTDRPGYVTISRILLKGERIDNKNHRNAALVEGKIPESPSSETRLSSSPDSALHAGKGSGRKVARDFEPLLVSTCLTCQKLQDDYLNSTKYAESGPAAPPSSPDISHHHHKAARAVPAFDKLLGSRPRLQPNSVLLADRLAALRLDQSQFYDHGFTGMFEETHRSLLSSAEARDLQTNSLAGFPSQPASIQPNPEVIDNDALLDTANWVLQGDKRIMVDSDQRSFETEDKKVAFQIYVPTAGSDLTDDETALLAGNSINRERPITHKTYKNKNK